ncbi:MAG: AraC family transcriptional regulator [Deltaproteobacteria bacterium]|nr:AraC family transcriptional regulator [Deltaproteobacteria bacterium]
MNAEPSENRNPPPVSVRNSLAPLIERYAVEEGVTETQYPGLILGRFNRPVPRYPLVYSPSVCVVAQGRKQVYSANERGVYDPLHYLVVALPLPLEAEVVIASPKRPFLALALEIDMSMIGKLLLEMAEEEQLEEDNRLGKSIYTSNMNEDLLNAVKRLLRALETPVTRRILGPGAVWEILYHVLKGEQGAFLRSIVLRNGGSKSIMRVVRYLQENYNKQHNINSIARYAGMSKSTLQHVFKRFVDQSPIQYLKKIRLHQARLMIVGKGYNASDAAHEVGYNSTSQFSREFKRLFGLPPSRSAENLQNE